MYEMVGGFIGLSCIFTRFYLLIIFLYRRLFPGY